jgi:hypothetical protein
MQTIKVKWTGIRPLVMHNGELADWKNPIPQRIKEIVSKGTKKLTEADFEERDRLEWEGGLYWDTDGPVIPADNIERCIRLGAQKSRLGKDVVACVFCTLPAIPLKYDGPKTRDQMYADPRFVLRKGIVINKARIIRVRPMIPTSWSLEFELEFDATIINPKALMRAMVDAGSLIGLGDWRPKFGRFLVEEL